MDMQKFEDHVVFNISSHPNSLFVIDDHWYDAIIMYENAAAAGFTSNVVDQQIGRFLKSGSESTNKVPVAMLPVIAMGLDLGGLVVGDFVRDSEKVWFQSKLESLPGFSNVAFLIDVWDRNESLGFETAEMLLKLGVPTWRIAFFTIGYPTRYQAQLETIMKDNFKDHGAERLSNWLERVEGIIDKSFFTNNCKDNYTCYYQNKIPHNPKDLDCLNQSDIEKLANDGIIKDLARRDKYGVWSWIRKTMLDNTNSQPEIQYSWLCGKAFLGSGSKMVFPYTALRGLTFGLGELSNISSEEFPITQPEDIDDERFLGCYQSLQGVTFNNFAKSLRNFIAALHGERRRSMLATA